MTAMDRARKSPTERSTTSLLVRERWVSTGAKQARRGSANKRVNRRAEVADTMMSMPNTLSGFRPVKMRGTQPRAVVRLLLIILRPILLIARIQFR